MFCFKNTIELIKSDQLIVVKNKENFKIILLNNYKKETIYILICIFENLCLYNVFQKSDQE